MIKFRVIKNKIILSILTCFVLIIFLLLITPNNFLNITKISIPTFSNNPMNKNIDLTGDGVDDKIEISNENNHYIINLLLGDKHYKLKSKDNSDILGDILPHWPIKIKTLELSRDSYPEVLIQCSKNNKPVSYIFSWNGKEFVNLLESNDNILGILDSNTNRTSKIFSLCSSKGDESTNSYLFNSYELKNISYSKIKVPGLSSIQQFIDAIEKTYELSEPPNIFSEHISESELSLLWNLDKASNRYSFQNGFFTDCKWSKDGEISSMDWILSFEKINYTNTTSEKKEMLLNVKLEKYSNDVFKVSHIKKVN